MSQDTTVFNTVAPLANVAKLTQLIERCNNRMHGLPGMGCFYGAAGRGKTTAGVYATNRYDACHIEALPIGGVKGLLKMIVVELGMKPQRTTDDLFAQIAQQLALTGRPLIIDEADHILSDRPIEIIRKLHDLSGAPVILMGEEGLPQKLQRWERVHSRMLSWVGASEAAIEDVDHLARIYAKGVELAPELKAGILTASRGSLRNVSTNLAYIAEHAAARGLRKMSLVDWGKGGLHTGEAPAPRYLSQTRRGAAA